MGWHVKSTQGSWIPNETAGGCRNFKRTFATNPQFRIHVKDPDDDDDDNLCTVIISLMQKGRRAMRDEGLGTLAIGFQVYHLQTPDKLPVPLDEYFFRHTKAVGGTKVFDYAREVTGRFYLTPGTYCIVPSTFNPGQAGDFYLRMFTQKELSLIF